MNALLASVNAGMLMAIAGVVPAGRMNAHRKITEQLGVRLPPLMDEFKIDTSLRIAHFLSELAHESDSFCTMEEYASGSAYEGRKDLGNTQKGDGVRYKGRGPIQLTGRDNYRKFTLWIRSFDPAAPDFERNPEKLEEMPWAAWAAIWFWDTRRLNVLADRDDLVAVTKAINGGTNGLADRRIKLARAKRQLLTIEGKAIADRQNDFPVLYRGVFGKDDDVGHLQMLLRQAGYYHLAIDGDFGAGTEGAVKLLQARLKLKVDGIAGAETFKALTELVGVAP